MNAAYRFLPWVRQGMATDIHTPDTLGAGVASRVAVQAHLQVNNAPTVSVPVQLLGPADITGIDSSQVIRTEPRHLATDFEPNYFPFIEFNRPDFPWLFTPAAADAQGRLRPWIALVVVRQQAGVTLRMDRQHPLPILQITSPAQPRHELPDLTESWAWAHAQVVSGTGATLEALLADAEADHNLSRLLCPRRLEPHTRYLACLVPSFAGGRQAGLGRPVDAAAPLAPAWEVNTAAPVAVELPVYHHWEFGTGAGGDFEALVRRLTSQPVPPQVGTRAMTVRDLGCGLPDLGIIHFGGALQAPETRTDILPDAFQEPLHHLLNRAATAENDEPLVAPPIYGCWHAWRTTVPEYGALPRWLRGLNLDPRYPAAAGLGTLVVQDQQEELMAAAWEQLEGIEAVNQVRRQAQLAQEVGGVLHAKHLQKLSTDRLFRVVGPLQSRVRLSPHTLEQTLRAQHVPAAASSTTLRRVVRPRGPLMKRVSVPADPQVATPPLFMRLATGSTMTRVLFRVTGDLVSESLLREHLERWQRTVDWLRVVRLQPSPSYPYYMMLSSTHPAAAAYLDYFARTCALVPAPTFFPYAAQQDTMHATVLQRLDPAMTVPARVRNRLHTVEGTPVTEAEATDPLAPMPHPEFPRPMYEALRDLSQDLLLPGLEHVPPESVTLLETNPRFIESFMVGLNHEISRELLWRRYPTDQRGTYFQAFWDVRGIAATSEAHLQPITTWQPEERLGEHIRDGNRGGRLVLLIRGELLRRYPGAIIYAAQLTPQRTIEPDPQQWQRPIFRGTLEPDVTFLGFNLSEDEARVGWYFVIQQQPTEPRFGLDVAETFGGVPHTSWAELTWGHLVETAEELPALSHVSPHGRLSNTQYSGLTWGRNAAHMAAITLQPPARIAIAAAAILPPAA